MSSLVQSVVNTVQSLSPQSVELQRQAAYEDTKFWNDYLCFFEFNYTLRGQSYSYAFPIAYSPEQYSITEPYLMEATNTLDGGLYIEEAGVTQRRISIQAHQGVVPHLMPNTSVPELNVGSQNQNYLFNDTLRRSAVVLSGQKHFQYLQQTVFRTYSDLKRNPTLASSVHLYWHNPQDDEHFEVVPVSFGLSRSNSSPMLYPYAIELLCIGPANSTQIADTSSSSFLSDMQNARKQVSAALSTLQGAVADINATLQDIRLAGNSFVSLLSQVSAIVTGVGSFIDGTKAIIDMPLSAVLQAIGVIENVMVQYEDAKAAGQSVAVMPTVIEQRWRAMQDALEILGTQPSLFQSSYQVSLNRLNTALVATAVAQTEILNPTNFAGISAAGTANLPGDAAIAAGRSGTTKAIPAYKSIRQYTVKQGDSLESIALNQLGDVTRYSDIVILNGLPLPITNIGALARASATSPSVNGGVLYIGQVIAIPSTQAQPRFQGASVVFGAKDTDSPDAQVFGRDVAMDAVGTSGLFDIHFALQADKTYDLATKAGLPVVQQAVTQQVTQEAGTNKIFAGVGLAAVVPTGLTDVDYQQMRFRVNSALTRDSRIASVKNLSVTAPADFSSVQISATLQTINGSGVGVAT